ncbi:MAG TPA: metallophosphoesterase, partial [Acidimicrobiales bacterium]|nr:metallophosphoesterase [Acidimicrobiales bacterium]
MPWLLAQISDLHVGTPAGGVIDTAPYVAAAVGHLNELDPQPQLVLASGDLAESGDGPSYARLAELLAPLRAPVVLLAGNHDERSALRAAFPSQPWSAGDRRLCGVVEGDVRLVLLDSVIPGQPGGRLGAAQIEWLDEVL